MRILVTGGSSFVGATFCLYAGRHHEVYALHHSTPLNLNGVSPIRVDLRRPRDTKKLQALDADVVVHIASKIRTANAGDENPAEGARRVNGQMLDSILALEKPIVYASSTVVHWEHESPYGQSRRDDEARIQQSGLPYAIIRPSAPYGPRLSTHAPKHRESFHTLVSLVRNSPVVPIIGNGKYRRQPLHLGDFSSWILALLEKPLPNRAYEAGGADALSMNDIVDTIARACNRSPRKLHLPKPLFVQFAKFSPDFDPSLIAAADEDELADPTDLIETTGHEPRTFARGVADLL